MFCTYRILFKIGLILYAVETRIQIYFIYLKSSFLIDIFITEGSKVESQQLRKVLKP